MSQLTTEGEIDITVDQPEVWNRIYSSPLNTNTIINEATPPVAPIDKIVLQQQSILTEIQKLVSKTKF